MKLNLFKKKPTEKKIIEKSLSLSLSPEKEGLHLNIKRKIKAKI